MSGAPSRHPRGGNSRYAALDREALFLQQTREIFRRLEFLISKLAETENSVVDHLRQLASRLDAIDDKRLECLDLRGDLACLLRRRSATPKQKCRNDNARSDVPFWLDFS